MNENFIHRMFSKSNTLVMVITTICFIISLILFFIVVIADYPNTIIYDKVDIILEYAKNDDNLRQKLINFTNEYKKNRNSLEIDDLKKKRTDSNNDQLHKSGVLPYLYVVIFLGICALIYSFTSNYTGSLEACDIILVFLAIIVFVVELIFYFIILRNWEYISDMKVIDSIIS